MYFLESGHGVEKSDEQTAADHETHVDGEHSEKVNSLKLLCTVYLGPFALSAKLS